MGSYQLWDVQFNASSIEPLGTKEKWWINDRYLFKANYESREEDWAEVVTERICGRIGLPHAEYGLAFASIQLDGVWQKKRGVVSRKFYDRDQQDLIEGNQLLLERDPAYPATSRYKVSRYTPKSVARVLESLLLPPVQFCNRLPPGVVSAIGIFIGYLMLDVLVANQDRHHENWGAIVDGDKLRLTPTFDHGAALAPGETDLRRLGRLRTKDMGQSVEAFAKRARSPFWNDHQDIQLSLYDTWKAFSKFSASESNAWLDRLEELKLVEIRSAFDDLPDDRISDIAREFSTKLVTINRQRLLNTRKLL